MLISRNRAKWTGAYSHSAGIKREINLGEPPGRELTESAEWKIPPAGGSRQRGISMKSAPNCSWHAVSIQQINLSYSCASLRYTTWWFNTWCLYYNMVTPVGLADTFITPHNCHFFWWWEYLISTLLGTFLFGHTARLSGSSFPDQGLNPDLLPWKCRVLTIGPPKNSQKLSSIYTGSSTP